MNLEKEIPDLVQANIISPETGEKIYEYYRRKAGTSTNRLFIVFGVLGSILVGLGIILIIAHNWEDLSRTAKTFCAFLPLICGQLLCGYTLLKKASSTGWRESSAAFLFFSVGACMALIAQVYHIPGDIGGFLLTWMALCLPVVYLMNASVTSLLYIAGITYYAIHVGYWFEFDGNPHYYWLLLAGVLPHYYLVHRQNPGSNFMLLHNWVLPLSVIICLGTVAGSSEELMFVAYLSLFGLLYLAGNTRFFNTKRLRLNGYRVLGALGTVSLLLALSFEEFWIKLHDSGDTAAQTTASPEFFTSVVLSLLAGALLFQQCRKKPVAEIGPMSFVFLIFIFIYLLGYVSGASVLLVNLLVFGTAILTVLDGARRDNLGILNFGLLIIAALVVCRFFDSDLSFVTRGLMFVTVGAAFFAANYWLLKKRKVNG